MVNTSSFMGCWIGMTARDKLNEAAFLLEKIHAPFKEAKPGQAIILIKNALRGWKAYLSAFLSAMRSVPDHLLEDYNIKQSLGIPLIKKLYPQTLKRKANQLKDGNKRKHALNFLKWWKTRMTAMEKDPTCSFLINLRHISVHRRQVQPKTLKVTLFASREGEKSRPSIVHGWFFEGYEEEDVLTMCDKYFAIIRKFVDEADQFL
jgi:hypothetical protein